MIVAFMIEVDGEIDPIAGGRDFELAVMADVLPIVAKEHFDDVAIPKPDVRRGVVGGQKEIQFAIRAAEEKVEIGGGPKSFDGGFGLRIFNLPAAILPHELFGRVLPDRGVFIESELGIAFGVRDWKFGARRTNDARRLRVERGGSENAEDGQLHRVTVEQN